MRSLRSFVSRAFCVCHCVALVGAKHTQKNTKPHQRNQGDRRHSQTNTTTRKQPITRASKTQKLIRQQRDAQHNKPHYYSNAQRTIKQREKPEQKEKQHDTHEQTKEQHCDRHEGQTRAFSCVCLSRFCRRFLRVCWVFVVACVLRFFVAALRGLSFVLCAYVILLCVGLFVSFGCRSRGSFCVCVGV